MINNTFTIFDQMIKDNPWWTGEILTPESDPYLKTAALFNKRVQSYPSLIIRPRNTKEAALVVKWSWENNIAIRLRGGGHSAQGYSSWNGVQLDTRLMNSIELNTKQKYMRLGAGTLWRDVYETLDGTGLAAVGGLYPSVGVAGFILGGGFNHFLSRNQGMGCDNVIAFKVVCFDGKVLDNVSENEHSDLWWALRGCGGGNLGLVTEITISLHSASGDGKDQYPYYSAIYKNTDQETWYSLMQNWRQWTSEFINQNEFRIGTELDRDPDGTVKMRAIWSEGRNSVHFFKQYIKAWEDITATVKATTQLYDISWLDFLKLDDLSWDIECPLEERWYGPSGFLSHLSDASLQIISKQENAVTSLLFEAFDQNKTDFWSKRSSFAHRDGNYLVSSLFFWEHESMDIAILKQGKSFIEALKELPEWIGSYINYIDSQITDWPKQYYLDLLPRLKKIRQEYDPHSYWSFPQSLTSLECKQQKQKT